MEKRGLRRNDESLGVRREKWREEGKMCGGKVSGKRWDKLKRRCRRVDWGRRCGGGVCCGHMGWECGIVRGKEDVGRRVEKE